MTDHFTSRFLDARRAYIRSRFPHLNPMQQEAVLQTEGPLLILAGAGSGKTTVLINRIYNLLKYGSGSDSELLPPFASEDMIRELEEHGPLADEYAAMDPVPPWQILAITFTNKAAGELKTRLETLLGESFRDIWACTFHSACVRILRRDCDRLGFTRDFTIYDTSDSLSLIKHILKDQNLDEKYYPPRGILSEISRAKGDKVLPPEFCAEAKKTVNLHRQQIGEIYTEYVRRLSVSDAMDFDDLLLFTVMLLSEHEDVLDYWQRRFRYVLIDEYQDTNLLQYELSSLIAGKYKPVILYCLMEYEPVRFNEMQRYLKKVADKTLSQNLKELEADGLIIRTVYPQIPPKVEYSLTERGHSLVKVLDGLCIWGNKNRK